MTPRLVLFLVESGPDAGPLAVALSRAALARVGLADVVRVLWTTRRPEDTDPELETALRERGLPRPMASRVPEEGVVGVDQTIRIVEGAPGVLDAGRWTLPGRSPGLAGLREWAGVLEPYVEALAAALRPGFQVGPHRIGGDRLVFLLGPCVLETEARTREIGEGIAAVCARVGVPWVFKASFDKANRSSATAGRGPGIDEGLAALDRIKRHLGVPLTTDVHLPDQAPLVAEVADLLQVPAFLCRQTDLLTACAATDRPVNVKKGQFMAPDDMGGVLGKLKRGRAMLTERGATFGYHNLVVDFRSLMIMRGLGAPVCLDATHAVQMPGTGADGKSTGGDRRFVPGLARAGAAMGIDVLFMEVHDRPEESPSDGPNMLRLPDLERVLRDVVAIDAVCRASGSSVGPS